MRANSHADPDGDYARYCQVRTFGSLDGLRAIAILAVVWHHTGQSTGAWVLAGRGFLGVDLFFVLSGFLIVTLLLREKRRTGAISLRKFYGRRILRIFPAYYFMLLFVGVVAFVKPGNSSAVVRHELPFAALYLSNLVPMQSMLAITWSLAVEEQFYLVIPTLEKYMDRALLLLLPCAYVLLSLFPFGFLPDLEVPSFFRETTFGPIILGVLLAHLLDNPNGFRCAMRLLGWRGAPLVALLLVVLSASNPRADISGWPRMSIHFALVALVAACVIRERHSLRTLLSAWPMRRIGIVSYGIYLYHLIIAHFVTPRTEHMQAFSHVACFASVTLLTWLAAELSYRVLETRFLRLKARFATGQE